MFDLPQSFLILPNPKSNAFSKTLRKTHLLFLRYLLQSPISAIPKQYQASIAQLRPSLATLVKQAPERLLKAIATQDIFSALIMLRNGQSDPNILWNQVIVNLFFQLKTLPEDFLWLHPISQIILDDDVLKFDPPIQGLSIGPLGISGQIEKGNILSWEGYKDMEPL